MPYILGSDKSVLDPLITALHDKVVLLSNNCFCSLEDKAYLYLRHVAVRVIRETALNAAEQYQGKRGTRYWLVVDHAGIALNIASELYYKTSAYMDTKFELFPQHFMPIPLAAQLLNSESDALISAISKIAGPEGYNYDGAYGGLVNYSMTELTPRVIMSTRGDSFCTYDVRKMIQFWVNVSRELYSGIARPYEDEQEKKNGKVAIYDHILERLSSKKQ